MKKKYPVEKNNQLKKKVFSKKSEWVYVGEIQNMYLHMHVKKNEIQCIVLHQCSFSATYTVSELDLIARRVPRL